MLDVWQYVTGNKICVGVINLLWPSDAMWRRHRYGPTLTQVMACSLTTSLYVNHAMLNNHQGGLVYSLEGNFTGKRYISLIYEFEYHWFKITAAFTGANELRLEHLFNSGNEWRSQTTQLSVRNPYKSRLLLNRFQSNHSYLGQQFCLCSYLFLD